MGQIAVQDLLK